MARFLANENAPREAVLAARAAGFDVAWMVELQPGANDETVLSLAQQDNRVLITFDKDFGELVFHRGVSGSHGVILLRPRLHSPEIVSAFIVKILPAHRLDRALHCCPRRITPRHPAAINLSPMIFVGRDRNSGQLNPADRRSPQNQLRILPALSAAEWG
jgi:predicted nuclease of predicted toxin-antitoxin system